MFFWTTIGVALQSLLGAKLRSFLAMLGIIIGVAAVIAMLAIGAGARNQVMNRISAMGANLLIVRPSQSGTLGVMSGTERDLTLADAEAIARQVPQVKAVAPVGGQGLPQVKYHNRNSRVSTAGTAVTYFSIRNFQIERGRAFTEAEVDQQACVAVLGPATVRDLFGPDEPLGATVKINGINFKVIGVLKGKGDQGWFNPDDQVLVPYTASMKRLFGVDYLREIDVQAVDGADLNEVRERIYSLLRKRHRADDVDIRNQAEFMSAVSTAAETFTILLGSIAGISLLVGGIGIMNIMLVTVTERTREIGVRKAIGAHERDILRQFLCESLLISAVGGVIGVLAGVGIAKAIEAVSPFVTLVQPFSVMLALGFALAVGVFFGWYPARRAALLDPIEALRHE